VSYSVLKVSLFSALDDDDRQQLAVPLLLDEDNDSTIEAFMTTSPHASSGGLLNRLLATRCAADCMPALFHTILYHGKYSLVLLLSAYLILLSCWLPFWVLSFLVTEWGVYLTAIASIFLIGRAIIRLIAFPGASRKVVTDIETEFAKYSVRMIAAAAMSLIDLAVIFEPRDQSGEQYVDSRMIPQIPGLWRRANGFRRRVLGLYVDVLKYIYEEQDSISSLVLSVDTIDPTAKNAESASVFGPELTRYGNNRLSGDVGNVLSLTVRCVRIKEIHHETVPDIFCSFDSTQMKARSDGRELLKRLEQVLQLVDDLEQHACAVLERKSKTVTERARSAAGAMKDAACELRDFVSSLKPPEDAESSSEAEGDDPAEVLRRKMEEHSKGSMIEAAKVALKNIAIMLDPPVHNSIFGLDVLRGCMLSRYKSSKQMWVYRPMGGMLDVLHFPAVRPHSDASLNGVGSSQNPKAVLYCNPNAGLVEVAAGMSLMGGNVPTAGMDDGQCDSWVDFYTEQGMDVFVFNYAGYGRSYGTTGCVRGQLYQGEQHPGCLRKLCRILKSALFSFQPTPDTLRADGIAVAKHLLIDCGVQNLYIHGESIGGIAASGTARFLSQSALRSHVTLLICDRTFCNLEAIAQRLVGDWTGYAIRFLTPFWNTDVTGDFLAASCPKVIASDAADAIIAEPSSLKSGIALWKELHRGIATTKGIGWVPETPLQYRMAEWENCCVNDTKHVSPTALFRAQPPIWPRDKHVSFEEAFHFAACCKRIGKMATAVARAASVDNQDLNSISLLRQPIVVQAWAFLGSCDGLTGATLGIATKRGFDATVTWLCAALVFGGQVVAAKVERRMYQQQGVIAGFEVIPADFDLRPVDFTRQGEDIADSFPKPIPVVLENLISYMEVQDETMSKRM
jgi:hypothetical protein